MVNPVGGLASGIDTMGLLEEMMDSARIPLDNLENKRSLLEIKKDVFNDVNDQLFDLKSALLELKLETTFKSKDITSSDSAVVDGTATTEAAAGSHTINISQLATSATARSLYTNSVLVPNPANTAEISSVFGRSAENIEGRYAVTITDEGSYYKAEAVFSPYVGGTMKTLSGSVTGVESATLKDTIANSIDSSDTLDITIGSDSITISLNDTTADVTMMSEVAADFTDKINAALNIARSTNGITYAVVRATGNVGSANDDGFVIYSMNNDTISVTGGTGTVQADLGLTGGGTQGTAQTITNTLSADNLEALLSKINDKERGLIRGVSFVEDSATGLATGTAEVDVSAELSILGGTPTYVYGGLDVATGASLNTTTIGLNNSGFSTTITGVYNSSTGITSGTFTINGITINISNIDAVSVNDVIGMINSSAANVTASYDAASDSFTLMSNTDGSYSISLGQAGDTSNLLEAAKLNYSSGASLDYGNPKGTIDKDATLSSAGFSRTPTSGTFTINDTTLYVDVSTDSIESLINKINNSNAGVIAAYDTNTDKFSLSSDQDNVTTNTNDITIGDLNDSSNILNLLNLQDDFYTSISGTVSAGADRAVDTVIIAPPTGSGVSLNIPATAGSGAYQTVAGTVNWIDGIADAATITGLAGIAGATAYTWTNNSGDIISDIDTFVTEWNKTSNWGSGIEIGVIKEGDNKLRFFSLSQAAGATFTMNAAAGDLYEIGVTTDTAATGPVNFSDGDQATASVQYNALNFAYAMNEYTSSTGIWVTTGVVNDTDTSINIDLTSNTLGYYGNFGIADEDSVTPAVSTIADYFGSSPQASSYTTDIAIGTAGEDAYFNVDNVNYVRTSNSIDDVIGGTTLNLKNTSASNIILNIEVDTDKGIEKLTDFIVVYNQTLEKLNPPQLTNFQKGFLQPLTDDEKANMTSKEIELYEDMHELYNGYKFIQSESSFRRLYDYFRQNTTGDVTGLPEEFNSITDLNIIPGLIGTDEEARKGYLITAPSSDASYADYIKDALKSNFTLMNYLSNNSDEVYKIFGNDSSSSGGSDGMARVLTDKVDTYTLTGGILKNQIKTAGFIDKDISLVDKQILRWELRIAKKEEYYWRKFMKMEEAIGRFTRQSQNLANMLGQLAPMVS
jgi:flagellar hook-associated protein 2